MTAPVPGAMPPAVGIVAVAPPRDQLGAGEHCARGGQHLRVVEVAVGDGDDHIGGLRVRGVVHDVVTGVGDVAEDRWTTDHEDAGARLTLRQHVLDRRADTDDLLDRRRAADRPQLLDVLLRGVPAVVGYERQPPAARTDRGDGLGRAGRGDAADPDGAVQVEDHLVVGLEQRGELHARIIAGVTKAH